MLGQNCRQHVSSQKADMLLCASSAASAMVQEAMVRVSWLCTVVKSRLQN
jgi:hypothetical protein